MFPNRTSTRGMRVRFFPWSGLLWLLNHSYEQLVRGLWVRLGLVLILMQMISVCVIFPYINTSTSITIQVKTVDNIGCFNDCRLHISSSPYTTIQIITDKILRGCDFGIGFFNDYCPSFLHHLLGTVFQAIYTRPRVVKEERLMQSVRPCKLF